MKIVIHAGLPKTGSTFLQDYVFPGLDGEECAYNPEVVTQLLIELSKEAQSGAEISRSRIEDYKGRVESVLKEVSAPTLLISVEGIMPIHVGGFQCTDRILAVLKELFPEAEIVVFLREQVNWIRSAYSFSIVSKFILPFEQFVNRGAEGDFGERGHDGLNVSVLGYDYGKIRDLVQKYYSVVHFFRFEDLFIDGGEEKTLRRMSDILEVSPLRLISAQSSNKGLDEKVMVRISKLVAKVPLRPLWKPEYMYVRYSGIAGVDKLKYFYLRYTGRLIRVLAQWLPPSEGKLFSDEEQKRIRDHYRGANEAFWKSVE